ncbi:MAG: phosphatidate cytidylyltransferase, partial [Candidatus Marinimicrobia bacterium]|nr:phosphatidate cytidylyltransferase [Candidatus Neomarinimicrobiota bacterium]
MISLKNEIARKIIHLSSIIIPIFLLFYGKELTLLYLLPITIFFLILDILRIRSKNFKSLYNYFFISITRKNESKKLTGASYVFLSSLIIIFFFSENIAVISLFIMIISDT